MTSERLFKIFIPPKNFYNPQNKFLATPLVIIENFPEVGENALRRLRARIFPIMTDGASNYLLHLHTNLRR